MEKVKEFNEQPDIMVLDPTKTGIYPRSLMDIIDFDPENAVNVSCNAKTVVRDLVELEKNGYEIKKVKSMDMLPHTPHVETAVLIEKK